MDQSKSNQEEISISEIVRKLGEWKKYLQSKWLVILLVGIITGSMGLAYALLKKPRYTAEFRFALEDEKASGGLSGALGLASQFGIDLSGGSGGAFTGDNLLELIKSRFIVQQALLTTVNYNNQKQTLAEVYIDFNKLRNGWGDKVGLKDVHFAPDADNNKFSRVQDSLLGEFHKSLVETNLSIDKIDKKLSIISVKVVSKNELFSKLFAEVLVDKVSAFYINTKTKKAKQNVNILQHQVDSVRAELNRAISGVASSIDAVPNPNNLMQILKVPSQHRQVDVQANTAILTELVKNLEIAKVSLRKETPLIQTIDTPILPLLKTKVNKIVATLIGLITGIVLISLYLLVSRAFKNAVNKPHLR